MVHAQKSASAATPLPIDCMAFVALMFSSKGVIFVILATLGEKVAFSSELHMGHRRTSWLPSPYSWLWHQGSCTAAPTLCLREEVVQDTCVGLNNTLCSIINCLASHGDAKKVELVLCHQLSQ